jgi:hypothetical protein
LRNSKTSVGGIKSRPSQWNLLFIAYALIPIMLCPSAFISGWHRNRERYREAQPSPISAPQKNLADRRRQSQAYWSWSEASKKAGRKMKGRPSHMDRAEPTGFGAQRQTSYYGTPQFNFSAS